MIFVDTNVLMYAVGRPHPLREEVRARLRTTAVGELATSAEVLQELLHAYLPVGRLADLDAALRLARDRMAIWPVTAEVVLAARDLDGRHPGLSARDLVHVATMAANGATACWTYDRALAAAAGR